jgi:hypothetical protein
MLSSPACCSPAVCSSTCFGCSAPLRTKPGRERSPDARRSKGLALQRFCEGVLVLVLALLLGLAPVLARADAASLRARHAELSDALKKNDFGRPLHIESVETGDSLRGEVHAVLAQPFETVRQALREPPQWCEVMILPYNTKYCHAVSTASGPALMVRIGRKFDQPLEKAYRLAFGFRPVSSGPDYFESQLDAREGPLGTRNYRIAVSAVPLDAGHTFLRLSYAYGYGFTGKVAFRAYMATAGADKVGFTRMRDDNGREEYIGGMRGAIERNAMRFYLAIDAYLASLAAPPDGQVDQRIQAWFEASERYPRQLHEMERATYVSMKRMEHERQRTLIE